MAKQHAVHVDFDEVVEILRKGVRRSDVFMGIGINSSEHEPPISHLLARDGQQEIRLVKQELNDEEKAHVAREFGKWVQANGVRELLETLSIFIHRLYSIIFVIRAARKQLDGEFNKCHPKKFERMGIGDQIERMAKIVSVSQGDAQCIRSFNKVRNCYAHRRGLVQAADLDRGENLLRVSWIALEMQVREPDGNVVVGDDVFDRVFKNGGGVELVVKERSKNFTIGNELVFEKRELKEICLCILSIGQRLFQETISVARNAGILKEKIDANLNDPKPI